MKKSIKIGFVFLITFFLSNASAFAQDCVDGFNVTDPGCDPILPCPCPIDDGVLLLIAFAVLIALKKAYDYKKQLIAF